MFNRVLSKWIAAQGSRLLVALIIFLSILWTLGDCATWGNARRGGSGSSACYAKPEAAHVPPRILIYVVGVYVVNLLIAYFSRKEAQSMLRTSQDRINTVEEGRTSSKAQDGDVVPSMQTTNDISSVTETVQRPTKRAPVPLDPTQDEVLDGI